MAKATAECTCKKCGEQFTRSKICPNRKQAESWEQWAEGYYDLCNKCYAKEQRELEIAEGLYVEIRLHSGSAFYDDKPIAFVFGGDTYTHKEDINGLGACWTQDYPDEGILNDLLQVSPHRYRWVAWCTLDDFAYKLKQIEEIGAKIKSMPSNNDFAMYRTIKNKVDTDKAKKEEALQKELASIGPKPPWPDDILALWPSGATWNGKFYGKTGYWSVYFNGVKIELTDEQKDIMEKTSKKRQEWLSKKQDIEIKYR